MTLCKLMKIWIFLSDSLSRDIRSLSSQISICFISNSEKFNDVQNLST